MTPTVEAMSLHAIAVHTIAVWLLLTACKTVNITPIPMYRTQEDAYVF